MSVEIKAMLMNESGPRPLHKQRREREREREREEDVERGSDPAP